MIPPDHGRKERLMAGFSEQQKEWMKLVVRKASRKEIFDKIFHENIENLTPQEQNKYDVKMWRWRNHPDYHKEWMIAFKEVWGDILADAVAVVQEGLQDDSLPWRRTQHANLALAYGTKILVGEEERTVHVQVESMPDIGSPDE